MDFQQHDNPWDSVNHDSREAERETERWNREQVTDEPTSKDEALLQEAMRLTSERD